MPPPPATPRTLGYVHAAGARALRGYPNPAGDTRAAVPGPRPDL